MVPLHDEIDDDHGAALFFVEPAWFESDTRETARHFSPRHQPRYKPETQVLHQHFSSPYVPPKAPPQPTPPPVVIGVDTELRERMLRIIDLPIVVDGALVSFVVQTGSLRLQTAARLGASAGYSYFQVREVRKAMGFW